MSEDRHRHQRDRGTALVRTLHASELQAAGAARAVALHEADQQLDRIARRLPDALASGLSLAEIARLTNVSRPTLYELRGRYSDSPADLRFAVLQAVATRAPVWPEELDDLFGTARQVVQDLVRDGLIEWDVASGAIDTGKPGLEMTPEGFESLEQWFDAEERAEQ